MFRRLADRVSSAVSSVTNGGTNNQNDAGDLEALKSLGFSEADAQRALAQCGGHREQAAEWLLLHATPTSHVAHQAISSQTEQDELQRAISESLFIQNNNPSSNSTAMTTRRLPPSAASQRAGQAALARFEQPKHGSKKKAVVHSHPAVKMPKKMDQHETEKVILRCAERVAPNALAVDTLLKSLQRLQNDSRNPKYRSINTASAGYQRTLNAPGTLDFFKAMGYHPTPGQPKLLELSYVDPAVLYLGISALEQIQLTNQDYQEAKALISFDQEMDQILSDSSPEEIARRADLEKKLPSESNGGGGAISIALGSNQKIQRRFDGDDCLEDVLNWMGSHASVMPKKLLNQEWFLIDRNYAEPIAYNVTELKQRTLQYIGCWPSGRLAIVPLKPKTSSGKLDTSSRALGAAPVSVLKL